MKKEVMLEFFDNFRFCIGQCLTWDPFSDMIAPIINGGMPKWIRFTINKIIYEVSQKETQAIPLVLKTQTAKFLKVIRGWYKKGSIFLKQST